MATCGLITKGAAAQCTALIPGYAPVIWVVNFADVTFSEQTANVGGVLTGMTLSGSATIFRFDTVLRGVTMMAEDVPNAMRVARYKHTASVDVFNRNFNASGAQALAQQLTLLRQGKYVVIVQSLDNKFYVLGRQNGVVCDFNFDLNNADKQFALTLSFHSQDGYEEGFIPQELYLTSFSATLATIVANEGSQVATS